RTSEPHSSRTSCRARVAATATSRTRTSRPARSADSSPSRSPRPRPKRTIGPQGTHALRPTSSPARLDRSYGQALQQVFLPYCSPPHDLHIVCARLLQRLSRLSSEGHRTRGRRRAVPIAKEVPRETALGHWSSDRGRGWTAGGGT